MANPSKFTVPPAPIQSPLLLRDGIITSPVWIAWLNLIAWPILQQANADQTSVEDLLLYRQPPATSPEGSLNLQLAGARRSSDAAAGFPPPAPRALPENLLSLLAATRTGQQVLPMVLADTHANRTKYPATLFYPAIYCETDRGPVYTSNGATWVYQCGQWDAALASIPTLGTDDAGYRFGVTDYKHLLRWSGAAWDFADGDGGSGFMSLFEVNPGTGWALYDGSTVNYLKSDGTTGSVTLPDLTSAGNKAAFLEGGSPNSGPTAAVAPTLAMDPYTPAGGIVSTFIGTVINFTTALFVATAGAVAALVSPTSITPAGTVGSVFTGTPATLTGTISATGEPRKLIRRPYFRQ